jgi:hypothetical protein
MLVLTVPPSLLARADEVKGKVQCSVYRRCCICSGPFLAQREKRSALQRFRQVSEVFLPCRGADRDGSC